MKIEVNNNITLKIDGQEFTLTDIEARELWFELSALYGYNTNTPVPPIIYPTPMPYFPSPWEITC